MTTRLEAPAQEPRNVKGGIQGEVHLAGVSRAFGDVRALEGVDLDVAAGETVAVVGPSGCGKTTLLELVCGLQAPDAGTIRAAPAVLMPQRDGLLPWLRAIDNAALAARLAGASRDEARARAHPLFAAFGLEGFERARPHELSGGMRQRVAFLRTLLSGKPVLCLDEPFGALDALTRDQLNLDLQQIWLGSGKTVMFVTHSISEAVFLSDRVAVFSNRPGRVVETLEIDLPRPRHLSIRETPEFGKYAGEIRRVFSSLGVLRDDLADAPPPSE
jgi:NitT/TauT family transport system ATP-binding protein